MNMSNRWFQVSVIVMTMGLTVLTQAAVTNVWSGAVNSDWSNPGNWTNGVAPTSTGLDSIWLEPGVNPPSNQDIVGLYINTLTFNTNTAGFTINGNDIKLKKVVVDDDRTTYVTNTVNCGIIIAANNAWNWVQSLNTRCWLRLNGTVSESGVTAYIPNLSYGYVMLAGSNTFSGGLPSASGTVKFFADRNLGAVPSNYVSNFFGSSTYSYVLVGSTGGVNRVSVHANRGLRGPQLAAEPNVEVTLNAPLAGSAVTFGGTRMGVPGTGTILLAGNSTNLVGDVAIQSGRLVMLHSNALGATVRAVSLGSGTSLELNGYDLIHNFTIGGDTSYAGYDSSGMWKNGDLARTSTLSGTVNASVNATAFGGRGDLIVTGPITNGATFRKTGSGTLTLKGANTNFVGPITTFLGGLTLDYTAENNSKIATNSLLTLQQTTLRLIGNASAATMQTSGTIKVSGTTCGAVTMRLETGVGQNLTLAAKGIVVDNDSGTRHALDIVTLNNGGGVAMLTTTNADGLLAGASATWNQSTWAKVSGGVVSGMADGEYSPTFGTTLTNVEMAAGQTTITTSTNALTLRFKEPAGSTLTINQYQNLYLGVGGTLNHGILMTPNSGPVTINGLGIINAYVNKGFVINQYSPNPLTLSVGLYAGGGVSLLKCGPGELIITSSLTSIPYLMGGTLTVGSLTNAGIVSPIGAGNAATPFILGNATFKYTGPTVSHDRKFQMNAPAAIEASGSGLLEFSAPTNVTVSSYTGNEINLTLAGSASGQMDGVLDLHLGGVVKAGSGTWTLGGTQFYTGDTVISNGTLRLSNNCVLARSLRVTSGGTLTGSATLGGDLVMNGTRRVEVRSDSDYDTLVVGFDATLGGTLQIAEMNGYKMPANLNMSIVTAGGTLSGSFAAITGGSFQIKTSADGRRLLLSRTYPGFILGVR